MKVKKMYKNIEIVSENEQNMKFLNVASEFSLF